MLKLPDRRLQAPTSIQAHSLPLILPYKTGPTANNIADSAQEPKTAIHTCIQFTDTDHLVTMHYALQPPLPLEPVLPLSRLASIRTCLGAETHAILCRFSIRRLQRCDGDTAMMKGPSSEPGWKLASLGVGWDGAYESVPSSNVSASGRMSGFISGAKWKTSRASSSAAASPLLPPLLVTGTDPTAGPAVPGSALSGFCS